MQTKTMFATIAIISILIGFQSPSFAKKKVDLKNETCVANGGAVITCLQLQNCLLWGGVGETNTGGNAVCCKPIPGRSNNVCVSMDQFKGNTPGGAKTTAPNSFPTAISPIAKPPSLRDRLKTSGSASPSNIKNAVPLSKPKASDFTRPTLPAVSRPMISKPITGIKTVPTIKNISKTPVRLPTGNVKTLKPALVSPISTPPGIPVPYPNTLQKRNLQQAPTGQRSGGFVPTSKVPGVLVAPGLQNNNNSNTNVASAPGDTTNKPVSLSVTFDSVVATAIVVVDANQKNFTLHWGDGESKTINLNGIIMQAGSNNNEISQNTYRLQHVYKKPFQGSYLIYAVGNDAQGRKASDAISFTDINPRYKFSFYSLILEFPDHLDSSFEQNSEIIAHMTVSQGGNEFFDHKWKKSVTTNPSLGPLPGEASHNPEWRIINSNFARNISDSDEPIKIVLKLDEEDGIGSSSSILKGIYDVVTAPGRAIQWVAGGVEFDGSNGDDMPILIHPRATLRSQSSIKNSALVVYNIGTKEGKIVAHFSYDLKLIVPVDSASQNLNAVSN